MPKRKKYKRFKKVSDVYEAGINCIRNRLKDKPATKIVLTTPDHLEDAATESPGDRRLREALEQTGAFKRILNEAKSKE